MHVFDAKGPRSGMVKASQRAALNVTDDTGREPKRGIKSYRKAVLQQVPRVSKRLPVLFFFILFFFARKSQKGKESKVSDSFYSGRIFTGSAGAKISNRIFFDR